MSVKIPPVEIKNPIPNVSWQYTGPGIDEEADRYYGRGGSGNQTEVLPDTPPPATEDLPSATMPDGEYTNVNMVTLDRSGSQTINPTGMNASGGYDMTGTYNGAGGQGYGGMNPFSSTTQMSKTRGGGGGGYGGSSALYGNYQQPQQGQQWAQGGGELAQIKQLLIGNGGQP